MLLKYIADLHVQSPGDANGIVKFAIVVLQVWQAVAEMQVAQVTSQGEQALVPWFQYYPVGQKAVQEVFYADILNPT